MMNIHFKYYLSIFSIVFTTLAFAQKASWSVYLANYENGIGSTYLRMDLKKEAPINSFDYLVIFTSNYEGSEDGMPDNEQLSTLYSIQDSLITTFDKQHPKHYYVGSFMHDNTRSEYFYVKDTLTVRPMITNLMKKGFKNASYNVKIQNDDAWKCYLDFMYPSEEMQHYMADRDVVMRMQDLGDNSAIPRKVEHWLFFKSKEASDAFMKELNTEFEISFEGASKNKAFPYELRIWNTANVILEQINATTTKLRILAEKHQGEYDGWETTIVKK